MIDHSNKAPHRITQSGTEYTRSDIYGELYGMLSVQTKQLHAQEEYNGKADASAREIGRALGVLRERINREIRFWRTRNSEACMAAITCRRFIDDLLDLENEA